MCRHSFRDITAVGEKVGRPGVTLQPCGVSQSLIHRSPYQRVYEADRAGAQRLARPPRALLHNLDVSQLAGGLPGVGGCQCGQVSDMGQPGIVTQHRQRAAECDSRRSEPRQQQRHPSLHCLRADLEQPCHSGGGRVKSFSSRRELDKKSFEPQAYPLDLFPDIFLTYMALGGAWLFIAARRRRGILEEIETDLEAAS